MASNAQTIIKTEAVATMISKIMGSDPVVSYPSGRGKIEFTAEQAARLRSMVKAQLSKKGPASDVQIVLDPVINPLFVELALPYAAILFGLGFLLSQLSKR